MSERINGAKIMSNKKRLYEAIKNMPKDEALRFIDVYKDNIKKRTTNNSLMEKRNKVYTMKELIKRYWKSRKL